MLPVRKPTAFINLLGKRTLFVLTLLSLLAALLPAMVLAEINRPGPSDKPTVVTVDIYILDIDEIDTANQSYDANVFVELTWQDSRLVHQGDGPVAKKRGDIWSPLVQIVNLQRSWKSFDDTFMVEPDGTVISTQRYWGSFSQPLKLKDFPFDTQSFHVQLISVSYSPKKLQFAAGAHNGIAENLSVADWAVTGFRVHDAPFIISTDATELSSFTMEVGAERKSGYFLVKVILPLIFIVIMSWVVFWIDPKESGTQISVAVTSMLTMIAYRFAVGVDMPKISYLTRLDFFIMGGTVLVFTSLIEVLITSTYAKIGYVERAQRIDVWARVLFPVAFIILAMQSLGGYF